MSGPSVQMPTSWLQSDELEDLGSDTVMLMLTALAYCADQTDDGWVTRRRLRKLWPVDDLDESIGRLAKVGEVEDHDERVFFVQWRRFILSEEEVDEIRAGNRERSQRSRRHKRGDHSMCRPAYCNAARSREKDRDATRDSDGTVRVSDGLPYRPDPTRPPGRGGRGEGTQAGSAGAPPATGPSDDTPLVPHDFAYQPGDPAEDDYLLTPQPCTNCGHGLNHVVHLACEWKTDPESGDICANCSCDWSYAGSHDAYEQYLTAVEEGRPWRPAEE